MSDKKRNVTTLEEASQLFALDRKNAPDLLFIAGNVGSVESKKEGLVEVSIAVKRGDETIWVKVTAANPMSGQSGRKIADYFTSYVEKGMQIAVGCKGAMKDEKFLNIYIRDFKVFFPPKAS